MGNNEGEMTTAGQQMPEDNRVRALETLEHLLAMPSADLGQTLTQACDLVAQAVRADKVDIFIYQPAKDTLLARGSSNQPLSALQKRLGLDVLAVTNGGRVAHVFQTGATFVTGQLDKDPEELRGVKESLAIKSKLGVPLRVAGHRRGVLMVASQKPEFFTPDDVRFAESVVRWIAMVTHRAELVEEIARNAAEQGRRAAAEELVTVLAHDLRNLLVPIGARLNLIQGRAVRDAREADLRDVDAASRALQRLSRMIAGILDSARIEQGIFHVERQPLDLVALTQEVARVLSTPAHPVEVMAREGVEVSADPERLRQVVENILSNAVRHSPQNAAVSVQVSRQKREDGEWAMVIVQDQGPGIAADILPHIFERFTSGKRSMGLGLGLYLAKQIADAHGGRLIAESSPEKGARFTLELPCLME